MIWAAVALTAATTAFGWMAVARDRVGGLEELLLKVTSYVAAVVWFWLMATIGTGFAALGAGVMAALHLLAGKVAMS